MAAADEPPRGEPVPAAPARAAVERDTEPPIPPETERPEDSDDYAAPPDDPFLASFYRC